MADEPPIITLDAAITKLSAHSDIDKRGEKVLAAAITLRDSSGRDRANALRRMTSTWGVDRLVKRDGKWKERPVATVASELETAVLSAATQWQPKPGGVGAEQHGSATHEDGAQQRGVAEHASSTATSVVATMARSGAAKTDRTAHGQGDASACEAGPAKKAKTTEDRNVVVTRQGDGDSGEPPAKKPRARTENATKEELGAAEHVLGMAVPSAPAQEEPGGETGAAARGTELFSLDATSDQALLTWLRAHETQPRCGTLLQQIREWTGQDHRDARRSLASAQGICVPRRSRDAAHFLQTVRNHFRSAIAQEKGRLATFDFRISTGASEHLAPLPAEAEQPIQAGDVVDLAEGAATRGAAEHAAPNRTVPDTARCAPDAAGDHAAATCDEAGKSVEPPEKKHRKLEEKPAIEEPAAAEHEGATELFSDDNSSDRAFLEWLRTHDTQPRCAALLQQISEWTGKVRYREMRALVKAQGLPHGRDDHDRTDKLRAAVRRHFREAVAKEKRRLAFFDFHISTGASEHLAPLPAGAEQPLQAADLVARAPHTHTSK